MMEATARNPKTGRVENCTILERYHEWQDGIVFESDGGPHDAGHVYGANEIAEISGGQRVKGQADVATAAAQGGGR